jgi:hypothetical protein
MSEIKKDTTENETKTTRAPYKKKAPTRGGARAGGGRPKGSGNKISGASIIAAIEKYAGMTYEEQLAQNYAVCVKTDDRAMIAKYDQMFLNKVIGDKAEMDITSGGEQLKAAFSFTPVELSEWKQSSND